MSIESPISNNEVEALFVRGILADIENKEEFSKAASTLIGIYDDPEKELSDNSLNRIQALLIADGKYKDYVLIAWHKQALENILQRKKETIEWLPKL